MTTTQKVAVVLGLRVALVAASLLLPLWHWAENIRVSVEGYGVVGVYVLIAIIGVWGTCLPTMPLHLLAGGLFGLIGGMGVVYVGVSISMILVLIIARSGLRPVIERRLETSPWLRTIDHAIQNEGWRAVLLLRLSNLTPAHVMSWCFGLSALPVATVLIWSWIGKAPGIAWSVALGEAGMSAASWADPLTWMTFAIGIVASIAAVVLLAKRTRALRQHAAQLGDDAEAL